MVVTSPVGIHVLRGYLFLVCWAGDRKTEVENGRFEDEVVEEDEVGRLEALEVDFDEAGWLLNK